MTHYDLSDKLDRSADKVAITPELIQLATEHNIKLHGLYCIRCTIFGKTYYGQSKNIAKVYGNWVNQLKNKSPRFPPEMHYDFADFGAESFEFYILRLEENYFERSRKREIQLELDDNVYNLWKNRNEWKKYLRGRE